ncbi:MAG TPA: discoidin domain-containing protein, partial [Bacteroidales bacterium]|nr:discoidin domain-containing protein [Bacteroidales bacterium]
CDAVYVADSPLGPYTVAKHNPFSYKPSGFINGAGHGSTFADVYGNMWHIATATISQKHMFERRLVLYPVQYDAVGSMYTYTKFGDYPQYMPHKKITNSADIYTGWMLLSYNKKVTVSSWLPGFDPTNITDENIRTYWSARTGNRGEYAQIDLGELYDVYALQINFAEHNTTKLGRNNTSGFTYTVEYSLDGTTWNILIDKSKNKEDISHDYIELPKKQACKYIRITNITVSDGTFALSGLRIFGKGNGPLPQPVQNFTAQRNETNKKQVTLSWEKVPRATGYVISYGSQKDQLYSHYMVYADTTVVISSLSATQPYYYSIEAFNEFGISKPTILQ